MMTLTADHPVLANDFKAAMRRLVSGVAIVTTVQNGTRHGMTATAVNSLSVEPPSILVCINRGASLHGPAAEGGRFCVNLLSKQQAGTGHRFAIKPDGESRFATGDWRYEHGLPWLEDAQANLFCETAELKRFATHTIFIGLVKDVKLSAAIDPLIYLDGGFLS
jgi:flavin reductase (DIM6/NTAB) family NADH-FMN oxidoreductase RutF